MQRAQTRHVLDQTVARMARDRGDISHRSKYPFEPASSSGCLLKPGGALDLIDFSCGCKAPAKLPSSLSPAPRTPFTGGTDAVTRATTAATHTSDRSITYIDTIDPSPDMDAIQGYCPSFIESAQISAEVESDQISAEVATLKMPARPKSRLPPSDIEENVRRMSVAIPGLHAKVHSPNECSRLEYSS